MSNARDLITKDAAREMERAVKHPTGPSARDTALEVLDRWFEAERRGTLAFEPGAKEILRELRPPRRH